jgi:hypothetical protein
MNGAGMGLTPVGKRQGLNIAGTEETAFGLRVHEQESAHEII